MLSTSRRTWAVATAIVGVATLAVVVVYIERSEGTAAAPDAVADAGVPAEDLSTGYPAPRPASIDDLVHAARLIVIGEIGTIVRQTIEGPVRPAATGYRRQGTVALLPAFGA